jgi:hypothetical protein
VRPGRSARARCSTRRERRRRRQHGWPARTRSPSVACRCRPDRGDPRDQPELAAQHPSETRRLRDLQRIREPGVKQGGGPRASRVLEVRAEAIHGVRRVRHRVTSPRPHPTFMTESPLAACWPPRARVSRISNRCPSISGNRAAQRRVQLRRDVPGADAPDDPRARPLALRRHCRRGALPTVASI